MTSQTKLPPDQQNPDAFRRPFALAVFSGFSMAALSLGLASFLFLAFTSRLRSSLPTPFLIAMAGLIPFGIAGSFGIWRMRRWGFYLYLGYTLLGYLLDAVFQVNPGWYAILFSLAFLGIGAAYFKQFN